jgi:hypothetical protein
MTMKKLARGYRNHRSNFSHITFLYFAVFLNVYDNFLLFIFVQNNVYLFYLFFKDTCFILCDDFDFNSS